ncbi:hypothetical protein B0T14DRAFT_592504 [Immersiella caudata]|uniref:Amino acid transporter n=1 Tax=Immersiella caudata TaxID=314043 RepID=A0AA40BUN4_9PEZI|nr:hypothetical protein B0T14DRAFT_592504 [Immersiella caudata]
MGYTPVFRREFSMWSCFSFALSISGHFGTLIAGFGALCLALSVAEISPAYPTSGAIYFTGKYLAPPEWAPIIAWLTGWLNPIGHICGSASHIIGVMATLSVFHSAANSMLTAWLNHFAKTYAVFHIAVLVAARVLLLAMQGEKHTSEYVFTHVEVASGWSLPGFSFLFGFLSVACTMTDYDATAHIAEEAKDPARIVPKAIALALKFTYVADWLYNIVLTFCMGEPASILASPIGQPIVQIFYNVMGKSPAIFFAVAAFVIMNFDAPLSYVWHRVWSRTNTQVASVWVYSLLCVLINLTGLRSYITIAAIFNLCAIALNWSYSIPILCKLIFNHFQPGPWNLGCASKIINIYAIAWTSFVSVIFLFPTVMPVKADNMYYAIVILIFVLPFSTGYWFLRGRFFYTGPRTNANIDPDITAFGSDDNLDSSQKKSASEQMSGQWLTSTTG